MILDYNTDAINCIFPDDEFPFELDEIQLTDIYKDLKYYNWNVTTDETVRPTTTAQLTKKKTFQSVSKLNEC